MADQEIKTTIDALVSYISEHGESNVATVAAALGIGEQTIVEWANILEKANIITVSYKGGKMFISPSAAGGRSTEQVKQVQQAEKSQIEAQVLSQMAVASQISAKINEFGKSLTEVETIFKTKYKDVKVILDRINAIENEMEEANKKIKSKSDEIARMHNKLKEDFDGMQKYSISLDRFNLDTNNARNVSNDIKNRIETYKQNIVELNKDLDKVVKDRRKNAISILNAIKDDLKELEDILNYDQKQISQYENAERGYKRDASLALKKIETERIHAMDEIGKSGQKAQQMIEIAGKEVNELESKLGAIKKDIGYAAEINDRVAEMRKQLNEATKQKDEALKQLGIILQELRVLNAQKGKAASKEAGVEKLEKREKKSSEALKDVKEKTETIEQNFKDLGK